MRLLLTCLPAVRGAGWLQPLPLGTRGATWTLVSLWLGSQGVGVRLCQAPVELRQPQLSSTPTGRAAGRAGFLRAVNRVQAPAVIALLAPLRLVTLATRRRHPLALGAQSLWGAKAPRGPRGWHAVSVREVRGGALLLRAPPCPALVSGIRAAEKAVGALVEGPGQLPLDPQPGNWC